MNCIEIRLPDVPVALLLGGIRGGGDAVRDPGHPLAHPLQSRRHLADRIAFHLHEKDRLQPFAKRVAGVLAAGAHEVDEGAVDDLARRRLQLQELRNRRAGRR
jgi:hypothetical protein